MKSNEIHILWSDYLHKHPILEQLSNNGFRIFFSMLTLVEYPRNQVALVRSTFAKHSPQAFVASLHQLLRYISCFTTSFLIKNAPESHF